MTSYSLDKNKQTLAIVMFAVVCMIVLSFASVPLYRLFCQVTGFGGTVQRVENSSDQIIARDMTIRFDGNIAANLPWDFAPSEISLDLKVGESKTTHYKALNTSDKTTVGTAVFNVTPLKAGKYFKKTECFCFTEQSLKSGESVEMPVTFFVDPEIINDSDLDDVNTITLSYSFFPMESKELDKAVEKFYDSP